MSNGDIRDALRERNAAEKRLAELEAEQAAPPADDGWEWGVIEIMGHRKHAGRFREEERFGAKMLRVDVPVKGDPATHGWTTHWYGGSAIFGFALADEAAVMKANKPYEPPARYSLPAPDDENDGADNESLFG